MRTRIIKIITFLGGIYFFLVFILPKHIFIGDWSMEPGKYEPEILNGTIVVGTMAFGLGVINLLRIHGMALLRLRKGWVYSTAFLIAMFTTTFVGLANWYYKEFGGGSETLHAIFWDFLFSGVFQNLGSAMFSLLAFYIAFAAYRSFRVQNLEVALMMAAALIVMLGQIPLGYFIWERLPAMRAWLMTKINVPVFRGIMIGSMIAGLSMSVRMWLSLDRTERAS